MYGTRERAQALPAGRLRLSTYVELRADRKITSLCYTTRGLERLYGDAPNAEVIFRSALMTHRRGLRSFC